MKSEDKANSLSEKLSDVQTAAYLKDQTIKKLVKEEA
jgi:hypothetical protein